MHRLYIGTFPAYLIDINNTAIGRIRYVLGRLRSAQVSGDAVAWSLAFKYGNQVIDRPIAHRIPGFHRCATDVR